MRRAFHFGDFVDSEILLCQDARYKAVLSITTLRFLRAELESQAQVQSVWTGKLREEKYERPPNCSGQVEYATHTLRAIAMQVSVLRGTPPFSFLCIGRG